MTRARDTQRQKCYNWEHKEFGSEVTELKLSEFIGAHESPQTVSHRVFDAWRRERYSAKYGYMTLPQCQELAYRAWKRWDKKMDQRDPWGKTLPCPRVTDGRGRRVACYGGGLIKLPLWARTPQVVLHETAHAIAETMAGRYRNTQASHGGEFMWVATDLYAWYYKRRVGEIRKSARAARLKVKRPLTVAEHGNIVSKKAKEAL